MYLINDNNYVDNDGCNNNNNNNMCTMTMIRVRPGTFTSAVSCNKRKRQQQQHHHHHHHHQQQQQQYVVWIVFVSVIFMITSRHAPYNNTNNTITISDNDSSSSIVNTNEITSIDNDATDQYQDKHQFQYQYYNSSITCYPSTAITTTTTTYDKNSPFLLSMTSDSEVPSSVFVHIPQQQWVQQQQQPQTEPNRHPYHLQYIPQQHHPAQEHNEEGEVVYTSSNSRSNATAATASSTNHNINNNNNTTTSTSTTSSSTSRIAFGSCNDPMEYNALWDIIDRRNPAAFIWAGDAIYADRKKKKTKTIKETNTKRTTITMTLSETTTRETDKTNRWTNDTVNVINQQEQEEHLASYDRHPLHHKQQQLLLPVHCDTTPDDYDMYYSMQNAIPGYDQIRKNNRTHIYGVYDDHDYGCNNADITFPYKQQSAYAFVTQLLGITSTTHRNSLMYQRVLDQKGLYGVILYDFTKSQINQQHVISDIDANIDADLEKYKSRSSTSSPSSNNYTYSNQTVAVFVLDVRSYKTPWKQSSIQDRYSYDYNGDYLGYEQKIWLQHSLHKSNATLHVIVSGLQYHAYRYYDGNIAESWSHYPKAQQELYDILLSVNKPTLLLSGDVHMGQFLQKDCMSYHDVSRIMKEKQSSSSSPPSPLLPTTRRLVEMTTSGMTHSWGTIATKKRIYQYNHNNNESLLLPVQLLLQLQDQFHEIVTYMYEYYVSVLATYFMHTLHYTCPWYDIIIKKKEAVTTQRSNNKTSEGKYGLQYTLEQNYGEMNIDWDQQSISLNIIGVTGTSLLSLQYTFDELLYSNSIALSHNNNVNNNINNNQQVGLDHHHRHSYLSIQDYINEINDNPKRYNNNNNTTTSQPAYVCLNHRGRDTPHQQYMGHLLSVLLYVITIVPILIVVPLYCICRLFFSKKKWHDLRWYQKGSWKNATP